MTDVLIRNVPDSILEPIKRWAQEDRRSLQAEPLTMLQGAIDERVRRERHLRLADELRTSLELTGRDFGDSAIELRESRDER